MSSVSESAKMPTMKTSRLTAPDRNVLSSALTAMAMMNVGTR